MMAPAEKRKVVDVGRPTTFPPVHVVRIGPTCRPVAPGERAPAVANLECEALRVGDNARGVTSMWTPHFLNGVFNPQGGSLDLSELGGQWL